VQLEEVVRTSMRAARVPGQVVAKLLAHLEEVMERYSITRTEELFELPDWNLWLVLVKSILSPMTKILRQEGYCHANSYLLGAFISLDERIAKLVREWVRNKCSSGRDPCCRNPECCNIS
jgi:hypothetical protein